MQKAPLLLPLVAALGSHFSALAQINSAYEVATWRHFKPVAVSYTLDDNTGNQLPVALPLFDKYGFKTTLFTVTNWGPNWAGLRAASANGHEVTSHAVSHPSLDTSLGPNPFADQTTLAAKSRFHFAVYSGAGQLVAAGGGTDAVQLGGQLAAGA